MQQVSFFIGIAANKYRLSQVGTHYAIVIRAKVKEKSGDDMIKMAVIADDLTGANDTALQFAKRQISASVFLGMADVAALTSEVLVIDSDSRDLSLKEAYVKTHKICEQLDKSQVSCIFKKIDSTLRGNWGAEVQAIADVVKPELVVIAPAYPLNRRITVGGYHLMDGTLLELTEIGRAPKTPVKDSYIPEILRKQVPDCFCAVVEYNTMRQGADNVRSFIRDNAARGRKWVVSDIAEEKDFQVLLEAVKDYKHILWVGSAGLADYMSAFYGWQGHGMQRIQSRPGPVIICAGSVSKSTQAQIAKLQADSPVYSLQIDAERALQESDIIPEYAWELRDVLRRGQDVLIFTAANDDDVEKAVAAGQRLGLSGKEVSEHIAVMLAEVIKRQSLRECAGLVLTGGDTAVHVCRSLGVDRINILAEVEPGVPLGYLQGEGLEPLLVVTKAGAFGSEEALCKAAAAVHDASCTAVKQEG